MPLSFRPTIRLAVAAATLAGAALSAPRTAAAQWRGEYYALPVTGPDQHPDVQYGLDSDPVFGLVENILSANRLPVATACGQLRRGTGCGLSDLPITDVNAFGEVQWWNGNGTTSRPDDLGGGSNLRNSTAINFPSDFFPGGMSDNSLFMRAARWSARAANDGTFTMRLTADDDAWLFHNGQLVLDIGGVKGIGFYSSAAVTVNAGDRFDLFFADRRTSQAGIILDQGGMITTTPEPASVALMGAGLVAIGAVVRRRRSQTRA